LRNFRHCLQLQTCRRWIHRRDALPYDVDDHNDDLEIDVLSELHTLRSSKEQRIPVDMERAGLQWKQLEAEVHWFIPALFKIFHTFVNHITV
jgi:hypothetical protein